MIVLDPDYTILAANRAYRAQFGEGGHAFVGHKCFQVSHHYDVPCDRAGEHCPMKAAQQTLRPDRVLHVHHTPRGPEHVDVELRPILDAAGGIVAYVERLTTVRSASALPRKAGLVGQSAAFNQAIAALNRVAPSSLPVLLLGESGTGKELFARALHEASGRAAEPFVVVDCSGLTETLFESELFGHEKGAFTGALQRKQGLVETANRGTLFLDEIGDVPLAMQVKLLRLIESSTYRRVGGLEQLRADFRLVAATHKDLRALMAAGQFRADLFYRISAFPVHLPALRERRDDVPMLVDSMLKRAERSVTFQLSDEAMMLMRAHEWPGNIRELKNVIDRACLLADDLVIQPEHLPQELREPALRALETLAAQADVPAAAIDDQTLLDLVNGFRGTRQALAKRLGMSERTLFRRLKQARHGE
jgi:DNA-binding NtrC family response regulator